MSTTRRYFTREFVMELRGRPHGLRKSNLSPENQQIVNDFRITREEINAAYAKARSRAA